MPDLNLDHLVYAVPDLQAEVERLDRLTGIRAIPGGQHPGWGTRNALIALGDDIFLELIGPDPEQPPPKNPRVFGIDALTKPRLVTWAAKARDLSRLVSDAARAGIMLGAVSNGRRRTPDGVLLEWQFTDPQTVVADGIIPFFIDWGRTPHPARSAAAGARLSGLRAIHPEAARVRATLARLGLELSVSEGPGPALIAAIDSPRGRIELQ